MASDRSDPFRMWSDLALMGVKAYASTMATGLETASRMMPAARAFPAPAIRRREPLAMWPAAGSFGSNNAVGAWVEATQTMMGVSRRPPFPFAMPWPSMPWPQLMTGPAAWPMGLPWAAPFAWPMSGGWFPFAPFAATPSLADPFQLMRLMSPMLLPIATTAASSWRYH